MKKRFLIISLIILLIIFLLVFSINIHIINKYSDKILDINNLDINSVDAIVVLGAKVNGDNLSLMFKDRLDKTIEVFNKNISDKILISADNEKNNYDEITPSYNYLTTNNINDTNIYVDKYGLSTYDSIYRLKKVYNYKKVIIISQKYHLYRALYIANSIGIDAYAIESDGNNYKNQTYREIREILARCKDFVYTNINHLPKYVK